MKGLDVCFFFSGGAPFGTTENQTEANQFESLILRQTIS